MCNTDGFCWITASILTLGWWLLASGLLFFTWNKVVAKVSSLKAMKVWHAFLVVATLAVFCFPTKGMRHWSGHHSMYGSCGDCSGGKCDHGKQADCDCSNKEKKTKK